MGSRMRSMLGFTSGVAVALGAVALFAGIGADAGGGPAPLEGATYVPIAPCRLMDTRPAPLTVGPRAIPLGSAQVHPQQVVGAQGNCNVPADATGVALNVTAVGPTAPSFLTVYPSDVARPDVSNLNYLPGQAPTPNKVDVKLSAGGSISLYNQAGLVNVIVDVSGYYTGKDLANLQSQLDGKVTKPAGAGRVVIGGHEFRPEVYANGMRVDVVRQSLINGGAALDCALAPVDLPDGVTVTRLTLYANDTALARSMSASLYRNPIGSGVAANMAQTPVSDNTGDQQLVDATIVNPVVNNFFYSYVANVCFVSGAGVRLDDVVVEFTYP